MKGLGLLFVFAIIIVTPLEKYIKPLLSPEPKILKEKTTNLDVDKGIYDIFEEYFILSKKDNNVFKVIDISVLEENKTSIDNSNNNREYFAIKYLSIGVVWTIITFVLVHSFSSNSVYFNSTKFIDLTLKSNWIIVSKETCEKNNGIFNESTNSCKSAWLNAKKICNDSAGRLPTLDEINNNKLFGRFYNKWTNTSVSNTLDLFFNATLGLLPLNNLRNSERSSSYAYIDNLSSFDSEHTKTSIINTHQKTLFNVEIPTYENAHVECVKGTNNYYLRNFDTK